MSSHFSMTSNQSQPTEQQFKPSSNGGTSYTSDANMGVYTSSSSLVLGVTGRTVWSNPGSPKSNMADTLKFNQRTTSYCDNQLPLPARTDATVVIGEGNHSAYINAFSSSNMSLVMSQMAGSHDEEGDDLPNEVCNSRNSNKEKLHAKMLMNQHSIPIDPLQGSDVYFREPASIGTDYSAEAHSDTDVDISVLLDSSSLSMGHSVAPSDSGGSFMVTGIGGDAGMANSDQAPFQYNQATVYEDPFDTMMRDLVTSELPGLGSSNDLGFPDPELLKFIDSGALAEPSLTECLSTPVNSDFVTDFDGMSIQPVQAGMRGAIQEENATGDNLDIIKMMNVQLKPTAPASLGLKESNHMVPMGYIPSPARVEHIPSPAGIASPYTPMAPIQASVPPSPGGPLTPQTPKTPCPVQKGPFELKSYVEEEQRVCEIGICRGLPLAQQQIATQAMFFSLGEHVKIKECLAASYDLKVAIDARAELSGSKFDLDTATLQFTMPKDCVHIDQWMHDNKGRIDLRDRQLVLQQVANFLAAVHTVGNSDKLCLWGSFVVWVAPNKRVYLLIDFPEMLSKMEAHAHSISYDPRIEDVKAIYDLYQKIFYPYINQDSSWVSPGVKQLVDSFNSLVADPTSVYRMAELARTLGERRLCRLEVELMTLTHYVYCVEHEPLQRVLAHITSMVPPVACDRWEVQWVESGAPVQQNVIASAHRPIRLHIQPILQEPVAVFASAPCMQGLSFKGNLEL